VLARRWGLPDRLARAIERHHADEAGDEALLVRLADMLAHYAADDDVEPARMLEVSRRVGLQPETLRAVMCDLPFGPPRAARTPSEPCPLSPREHDILCRLAEGKVYKQIGLELGISASTVRTHLHNVYAKIGAVDRAQAVLRATERGWI
jgi:DNA-binding CsgD family transcriptional regulator